MKHAIIIGGSGMLAGASLSIAEQRYKVSLIGKNSQKLTLPSMKNSSMPVYGDYSKLNAFKETILELVRNYGPPQIVVGMDTRSRCASRSDVGRGN